MKQSCESCHGTGQISYFKGVSRFHLSSDECPECGGLGFVYTDHVDSIEHTAETPKNKKRKSEK